MESLDRPPENNLAYTQRRVSLETVPEVDQVQVVTTLAWAILSAAYSEDNEASIDALTSNRLQDFVHISFHLNGEQLVSEAYNYVQEKLNEGKTAESSCIDILDPAHETIPQNKSALPRTLITVQLNEMAQKLVVGCDYTLAISCHQGRFNDRTMVLGAYYNSSRLVDRELRKVLEQFGDLITQLSTRTDKALGEFGLMCPSDKEQLRIWNESMPPPLNAYAHELIEQQVEQHQQNEAVCAWDGSFTYAELDRRASALAGRISALGVGVGYYVPLMFAKSKWHVVSLLAVRNRHFPYMKHRSKAYGKSILGSQSWGCVCCSGAYHT